MKKNNTKEIFIVLFTIAALLNLLIYRGDVKKFFSSKANESDSIKFDFHEAKRFKRIGQLPGISDYSRLPIDAESNVRAEVWALSKKSSGIAIASPTPACCLSIYIACPHV
jgi:hypothetical protein